MSDKKGVQGVVAKDYTDPEATGGQQAVSQGRAHVKGDGEYGAGNTGPNSSGVIAHQRDPAVDETHQDQRVTSVPGDNDKIAMDVAISDSDGNHFSEDNPLPVHLADDPGDEIHDFAGGTDVTAGGGTQDHDYVVSASRTLKRMCVEYSATNEGKFELQIETAVGSGTFTTVNVGMTSASSPAGKLCYNGAIATGITVRVKKHNYHNIDNCMYSAIQGIEVA